MSPDILIGRVAAEGDGGAVDEEMTLVVSLFHRLDPPSRSAVMHILRSLSLPRQD